MKYERGQFGERWILEESDVDGGVYATNSESCGPTSDQWLRAHDCVNALDGLDPEAVQKIAAWWRDAALHSRQDRVLEKLLNQLIGANDE